MSNFNYESLGSGGYRPGPPHVGFADWTDDKMILDKSFTDNYIRVQIAYREATLARNKLIESLSGEQTEALIGAVLAIKGIKDQSTYLWEFALSETDDLYIAIYEPFDHKVLKVAWGQAYDYIQNQEGLDNAGSP